MVSAGVKEVKAKLSAYLDKVQKGEQVVVTEHGREVAMIVPISKERKAVLSLVESGKAHWDGGKPKGIEGLKIKGKSLSNTILEERL
jgi:prevent-host-death family protein